MDTSFSSVYLGEKKKITKNNMKLISNQIVLSPFLLLSFSLLLTYHSHGFSTENRTKTVQQAALYAVEKKQMDFIQARAELETSTTSPTGKAMNDSEESEQKEN